MLKTGITFTAQTVVTEQNTAKTLGSGTLDVFATPAMTALMEEAAWKCVQPYLEQGSGTVGTSLNIEHISASPIGAKISARAELAAINGRELTFNVTAQDNAGLIGKGTHTRFIIFNEKFQAKANSKIKA